MKTPKYVTLSMKTISDNGIQDLYVDETNNLAIAVNSEAIRQHIWQRLKTFLGEWFLDNRAGVPWLDQILGKSYNPGLAEAVVKTVIMETAGVTDITTFSIHFDRRLRHISNAGNSIVVTTVYNEEVTV